VNVQIVMFDGVEELDALGPLEVLGAARALGAPIEPTLVALGERTSITMAFGTALTVRSRWSPERADVIVVPGGGYLGNAPTGTRAEIDRGELPAALRHARRDGLTIAGVCTGVMLLAAAGLTERRPCTTHPAARDDLIAAGAHWIASRVVDDRDLLSCGGVTSGLDLALWLVERHSGVKLTTKLERYLHYERRGTVWTSSSS
jgi:transcriptional regulator GlxA family with amidase domain